MKIVKQCVGIDISKSSLECCIGTLNETEEQNFSKTKLFNNNSDGFRELTQWVDLISKHKNTHYVMEATGVYYESLAYWLHEKGESLSVLLPNKINHFAKSHNIKTKTDWVDAKILSQIGLERKLKVWSVPSNIMREVKFLTREYRELKFKITAVKNQIHAKSHSYKCPASTLKRLKRQEKMMATQIIEVEAELRVLVMSDRKLYDQVERLETIPGVSFMTIICILGETNCFALVRNAKQLVSYCGMDIRHNQSGSKEGKTRISKKGNGFIRHALYMPALCATRHNPVLKEFYVKLSKRKAAKKIAVTAVARKILITMYVLWKNETEFDLNYKK